jgi:hypothetical protein
VRAESAELTLARPRVQNARTCRNSLQCLFNPRDSRTLIVRSDRGRFQY